MQKPPLIDQPTAMPTRKVWAGLVAAAVTAVAKNALVAYLPLLADPAVYDLIQTGVIGIAMYRTSDRA